MSRVRPLIWLLLLFIVAAAIRLYQLDRLPRSLSWDEVAMLVDVKAVVFTGHDMHGNAWWQPMFPSWGDYKLPMYLWSSVLAAKLIGVGWWAVRAPSAMPGAATVLLTAGIAAVLHRGISKSTGAWLWPAVVVTLAPWSVVLSRAGFEANLGQCLLALSIWVTLQFAKSRWANTLAAVLGAVSVYTYYATRFVWPVVFIFAQLFVFMPVLRQRKWATLLKLGVTSLAIPLAVFVGLLQPLTRSAYFAPSQQFRLSTPSLLTDQSVVDQANHYRQLAGATPLSRLVFSQKSLRLRLFAQQLANHLSPDFLFFTGDENLRHGTGVHGLFLLVWLPGLFIGITWLWWRSWPSAAFLTAWWLTALVPAAIPIGNAHALRSLNALVPASIFVGTGLWVFAHKVNTWFLAHFAKRLPIGSLVVCVVTMVNFWSFWQYYTAVYPYRSADAWSDGYQALVESVSELTSNDPTESVLVKNTDGRIPLWFLASDRYPAQQFTSYPSKQYLFEAVGTVRFANWPSEQELLARQSPLLLVGDASSIAHLSPEIQLHLVVLDTIYSSGGNQVATIARYTP